ncbi:MAG: 4-alpha-glucanotransferase [Candidatus Latescibacterota bacterium]
MTIKAKRRSGVLLHINSLHGPGPAGTLGEESYQFITILSAAGQSIWQMLPIHPPDPLNNPYSSLTAFGGNTDIMTYDRSTLVDTAAFDKWHEDNKDWISDWALFKVIKQTHDHTPWHSWPKPLRERAAEALRSFRSAHDEQIREVILEQFLFDLEWSKLHAYASSKNIKLFGDMPFFVAWDSADVWANRHLFNIAGNGRPTHVAGVPPDYFSKTGQRWGNPLYVWDAHAKDGFKWWRRRLEITLRRFDLVRIDHFRAIEQYWSIPAKHRTARKGRWLDGPGMHLMKALAQVAGPHQLVAEDLGIIHDSIIALRQEFDIPGMAVLHFAFDSKSTVNNIHHPDHMHEDVICYPGTHDNDTTVSWFNETKNARKPHLRRRRERVKALMRKGERVHHTLIRTAMESRARTAICSMQDLLGLGGDARMNTPGRLQGNWRWRMTEGQLEQVDWNWLENVTRVTERTR